MCQWQREGEKWKVERIGIGHRSWKRRHLPPVSWRWIMIEPGLFSRAVSFSVRKYWTTKGIEPFHYYQRSFLQERTSTVMLPWGDCRWINVLWSRWKAMCFGSAAERHTNNEWIKKRTMIRQPWKMDKWFWRQAPRGVCTIITTPTYRSAHAIHFFNQQFLVGKVLDERNTRWHG